jgi:hypothetical protein
MKRKACVLSCLQRLWKKDSAFAIAVANPARFGTALLFAQTTGLPVLQVFEAVLFHPSPAFLRKIQINSHTYPYTAFFSILPQTKGPLKKVLFLLYFIVCIFHSAFSQDSCSLRISLLTCAPGAELYSTFGHTAIRVSDRSAGLDEVYNYGTFEFDDDFYVKFVRGKLLYALSVESFPEFMYQYQAESRSVIEQQLSLSCNQKAELYSQLRTNALPQNRQYRYDFLFDNCTTRARDMIDTGAMAAVHFKNLLPPKPLTFREHITVYLNKAHQDWSKLGIDLLLGAKMDRAASNTEAMFLPNNLMLAFDHATAESKSLVASKQTILPMPSPATESFFFTPLVTFGLLLLIAVALSFAKFNWTKSAVTVFDFILFFALGLVGLLLLFMWFGTDHKLCANNYNLLWALPTNLVAAFVVHKKRGWAQPYFKFVFWLTVLLLAAWAFLPQQMNNGFLPLVLTIALRSWIIANQKRNANKNS